MMEHEIRWPTKVIADAQSVAFRPVARGGSVLCGGVGVGASNNVVFIRPVTSYGNLASKAHFSLPKSHAFDVALAILDAAGVAPLTRELIVALREGNDGA